MEKLLIPLFAVLFMFSACTGSLPLPEESGADNSTPQPEQSVPKDESSVPEADSEDINIIEPVVSPDGKLTFTAQNDGAYVTDEEGNKTTLDLSLCPENAKITAAVWREGSVYITFSGEKDTLVCWDTENDPVYIKEGVKNSFSPLSVTDYGVIQAGEYLVIPYHDGTMDSPVSLKDMVLGYVVYYDEMREDDILLSLDTDREAVSVIAREDCTVTILDCETGNAVSEEISLKAGQRLFVNCAIPEGMPAYKISVKAAEYTSLFTLAYDGRGETNVFFLTPEMYK